MRAAPAGFRGVCGKGGIGQRRLVVPAVRSVIHDGKAAR